MYRHFPIKTNGKNIVPAFRVHLPCTRQADILFVQIMKQEHSELSREAHDCVASIPDLNKMVFAVQALGKL